MKNTLTYCIPFSFKGETFRPQCTIDLDDYLNREDLTLSFLYENLAKANHIDVYSYQHDVLMMGEIEFESAEGLAAEFLHDGKFDTEAFEERWHAVKLQRITEKIAAKHMGVDDIDAVAGLKEALLEAIDTGKKEQRRLSKAENQPADKYF